MREGAISTAEMGYFDVLLFIIVIIDVVDGGKKWMFIGEEGAIPIKWTVLMQCLKELIPVVLISEVRIFFRQQVHQLSILIISQQYVIPTNLHQFIILSQYLFAITSFEFAPFPYHQCY